ncbi:alpha/beta hydrolase [Metabacillus halosaccharovorans]|uniref:alpha/beta hydrolase n=1 Tax=Metabacillus halosaccharovorans TaxID=930124 RepID=UPI00203F73DB|nr:alpha/beta hydrolase [Metabacillus halosaccharovorans]MCM3442323.1 alpha/beta hydrolase [Metabacillus halosaccharovorans]
MKHIFIEGKDKHAPTLLLLHGTGGNEKDLLPIAEMIAPDASVLGVKGNVSENGMPRFFRRISEGVFDEEDLIFRTNELNEFLEDSAKKYQFDRDRILAIGYSNGANIAASLMYHHKNALQGAILLHAMVPRRKVEIPNLDGTPIFIGAGVNDPIIPIEETKELADALRNAQANITEHWGQAGHQLTREEIEQAKTWYEKNFKS